MAILKRRKRHIPRKRKLSPVERLGFITRIGSAVSEARITAEPFRKAHNPEISNKRIENLISFANSYRGLYYYYKSLLEGSSRLQQIGTMIKISTKTYKNSFRNGRALKAIKNKGAEKKQLIDEMVQHIDRTTKMMEELTKEYGEG